MYFIYFVFAFLIYIVFFFYFYIFFFIFFFFSSRRRHTRCLSDWSSDVCSSDLVSITLMSLVGLRDMSVIETPPKDRMAIQTVVAPFDEKLIRSAVEHELERGEIGRASCRERV